MTLNFDVEYEFDLVRVNMNHHTKHLLQSSYCMKVIIRTLTDPHSRQTALVGCDAQWLERRSHARPIADG